MQLRILQPNALQFMVSILPQLGWAANAIYIYIYIIQMPVNNEEKKNLPVVPDD